MPFLTRRLKFSFYLRKYILSHQRSLNFMLVYVWSRRNPFVRMNFLGFLNFNAPYLPWVLMAFNVFIYNHWPWSDIQGLVIGHIFYFLEDVYPRMPSSGGRKLLEAPRFLKQVFRTRDRGNAALPDAVPNAVPRNLEMNFERDAPREQDMPLGDAHGTDLGQRQDGDGSLRQRGANQERE